MKVVFLGPAIFWNFTLRKIPHSNSKLERKRLKLFGPESALSAPNEEGNQISVCHFRRNFHLFALFGPVLPLDWVIRTNCYIFRQLLNLYMTKILKV